MINSWCKDCSCKRPLHIWIWAILFKHTFFFLTPMFKPGFMPAHRQILFWGAVRSPASPGVSGKNSLARASGSCPYGLKQKRVKEEVLRHFLVHSSEEGRELVSPLSKGAETLPLFWINILSLWPQYVFCAEVLSLCLCLLWPLSKGLISYRFVLRDLRVPCCMLLQK